MHSAFVKLSARDIRLKHGLNMRFPRSPVDCGLGIVSGLSPRDATSVRGSLTQKRSSRVRKLLFSVVATTRRRKVSVPACQVMTRGFAGRWFAGPWAIVRCRCLVVVCRLRSRSQAVWPIQPFCPLLQTVINDEGFSNLHRYSLPMSQWGGE